MAELQSEAPADAGSAVPARERLRDEIWAGLTRSPPELSSKWFYDTRGSELFEAITRLPEYYPTRTEQRLLERWAGPWAARLRPRTLVELGAGSARKTRVLIDAIDRVDPAGLYVPIDVSADFLEDTARALRHEYPGWAVEPEVADLGHYSFGLSLEPQRPALVALLGSTIGNFSAPGAVRLLRHVRALLEPGDVFLLGADLRPGPGKPIEMLEAAYNDAAGVTAEFNRNMLRALNREAGTDFDVDRFRHRAFYEPGEGRIEMHLVAEAEQTVRVPGRGDVRIAAGESVRTEISCKYDRPTVEALFDEADLALTDWVTDRLGRYALVLGEPL
jgi:L-histidine N-alpha-methyltransferase